MRKRKKFSYKLIFLLIIIGIIIFLNNSGYIKFDVYAAITNSIDKEKDNMEIILVNRENKIPDNYIVNLVEYDGHKVDSIMINDLDEMFKAARKDGISLNINTSYRDKFEQQAIYDRRIETYKKEGMNEKEAIQKTDSEVQKPGYSEHETGLAIDFSNPSKPEDNEPIWNWLDKNAYKYGFILRYPEEKESITKVTKEEWHYRYVGKRIAKEMKSTGECLEEYIKNRLL